MSAAKELKGDPPFSQFDKCGRDRRAKKNVGLFCGQIYLSFRAGYRKFGWKKKWQQQQQKAVHKAGLCPTINVFCLQ